MPTQARYYSSNAAKTTLAASISSSATSLTLAAASNLPAQYPYTLILEKDTANEEVVEVTSLVGSAYQITRNIDSSGAKAHAFGANVEHGVSARDFTESRQHEIATTGIHGVTGDIVGTSGAQTLASKTLTTPTINGATISGTFTSTATISGGTINGAIITGLATPTTSSSAATKGYIDTSVTSAAASATAAATSAASAATSASSALTSASSALTSQTSAATSASSAATSASSAATSASTMAASVSSAQTSASSAATSAASALTSQTSAATSATSAATSATSAANSATAAASSATTAAASVATISTFATTASNSASAAATSATSAAASASAAATSATSAAASATAAATSATSASASATAAATSATSAATSASSALTSQTAAATSAASAATSASSALTSQTAAATSAASAATSATDAATTYDNFDDRYLGSKASAPTLDNDGNTLLVGAIYWNSALNNMYVWSGSVWVQIATTSTYAAPTLGSQTIASGTTYTNINDLTLNSTTIPTSKTLVDTNSSQTLTNKTLDGGLAAADPTVNLGLATKQYVDNVTTGINFHAPVVAATTANIVGTYSNGSSGVGATLTVTATGVLVLDGITTALNNRILVKDQTTQLQNGIYTVTTAGTSGVSAVLTRATDNDNNPAGEMANGDIVDTISGTVNTGKTFVNSTTGTITIGTTAITYSSYYSGLPAQAGSNGLYLKTNGTEPSWSTAVTSVTSASTSRISIGGTASAPTVDLVTTGVTAATYTSTTLTVDAYGRITSASTGASGGAQISDIFLLMGA